MLASGFWHRIPEQVAQLNSQAHYGMQARRIQAELSGASLPMFVKMPFTDHEFETMRLIALTEAHFVAADVLSACTQPPVASKRKHTRANV